MDGPSLEGSASRLTPFSSQPLSDKGCSQVEQASRRGMHIVGAVHKNAMKR